MPAKRKVVLSGVVQVESRLKKNKNGYQLTHRPVKVNSTPEVNLEIPGSTEAGGSTVAASGLGIIALENPLAIDEEWEFLPDEEGREIRIEEPDIELRKQKVVIPFFIVIKEQCIYSALVAK